MSVATMRIGDLAEQVGVSTSAIRFYEGKGLLVADDRVAGQRRYSQEAVERLRLVVMLRQAGLSCADIAVALDPSPDGGAARRQSAVRRLGDLHSQVLTTISALVVVDHVSRCHRARDDDRCVEEIARRRDEAVGQASELLSRVVGGRASAQP